MFKKVHLRLTLLCAGITAAIMTIMSFIFLLVSEKTLYQNQFRAFENDINTITTNLEHQSVISMEWISKMEAQSRYIFFITDNGVPFLYNILKDPDDKIAYNTLLEESNRAYQSMFEVETIVSPSFSYEYYHFEYEFTSESMGRAFFASKIFSDESSSALEINILYSLEGLEKQIWQQRFRFILIDIAAVLMLSAFSYFFTGKLLRPIVENHKKQAQFIASASHELRTPLAVILSAAECCQSAAPDNNENFLKTIRLETLRMSTLVNDMLTLSSSDNNSFDIKLKSIELDTLLINAYDAFKPMADNKQIELAVNLPEQALPPCSADPDRIMQVVSILLHNAISYTPKQGKVSLSLSYNKERFYISVTDNGIGISGEDKKKIFDRFYRAEKSRSAKGHFGLGLSIAYEIVTAHGGKISVADAEGGGCVFTVTL